MYDLDSVSLLFGMFISYVVGIIVSVINACNERALYYRHKRKNGDYRGQ